MKGGLMETTIKDYIIEHGEYYRELFADNIALRETLLQEDPYFSNEINKGFLEVVKDGIVNDVTKSLGTDPESVHVVLDDMSVYNLLEIY